MSKVQEIFDTMNYGPAPEADTLAHAWLAQHAARFELFIDGRWVSSLDGMGSLESRNPASGEKLADLAVAGRRDVDRAVAAAAAAAAHWAKLSGHRRARVLYALARLIKSAAAYSQCSKVSTTASRSASLATLIYRWSPGTSTTMPGGRSSCRVRHPVWCHSA